MTITARKAQPVDRPGLVVAMSDAFFDDPVFRWCTPDDRRRREILPGFFELALGIFAVAPAQQRRGHGSAMLRAVLDRADVAGVPAYLEATSPVNRRLYERHGFVVTGELALAAGPPLWAMWREPRG